MYKIIALNIDKETMIHIVSYENRFIYLGNYYE